MTSALSVRLAGEVEIAPSRDLISRLRDSSRRPILWQGSVSGRVCAKNRAMRNRVRDRPRLPQHEIPSKGSGPDRSDSDFHLHLAQKTVQREIGSGTALGCLSAESRAMRNRTDFGTSFPASRVRAALDVREPAALDVRASMARHPGSDRSLRGQCLSDLSRSERCLGRSI